MSLKRVGPIVCRIGLGYSQTLPYLVGVKLGYSAVFLSSFAQLYQGIVVAQASDEASATAPVSILLRCDGVLLAFNRWSGRASIGVLPLSVRALPRSYKGLPGFTHETCVCPLFFYTSGTAYLRS